MNDKTGFIHHIEFYVSDLAKSSELWGWFLGELGYEPYQKWERGISWKLGPAYLVLVQAQEKFLDVPYHRARVGMNHIAFHAESRQQVDDITLKLKERGVRILYEDRHPHAGGNEVYALYFEEFDGMKVELVAP